MIPTHLERMDRIRHRKYSPSQRWQDLMPRMLIVAISQAPSEPSEEKMILNSLLGIFSLLKILKASVCSRELKATSKLVALSLTLLKILNRDSSLRKTTFPLLS